MNDLAANLMPLAPELLLAAEALLLLLIGVLWVKRITPLLPPIAALALLAPMILLPPVTASPVIAMNGMFIADAFGTFFKFLILGGAALVLLLSSRWLTEDGGKPFEFLALSFLSALGMMAMASAHSLLIVYLSLELTSLPLYVLAAFSRDDARASEAGLKYFVLGALASGMMLFGISLIYGFTGSIGFDDIITALSPFADEGGSAAGLRGITLGLVLLMVGLLFKVAAVPFHMWSPDVYEGAPTPVTTFFAVAPKAAAFALLTRVLMQPFADLVPLWRQVIVAASAASLLLGALAALRQTNIKRLLAYSSIGHVGFMLMGLAAGNGSGAASVLLYMITYIPMSAAAFGVVLFMRRNGIYAEKVADLAGLSRQRPWLALTLAVSMFSMAGIPPLAGFFGKFYVVMAAVESGLTPLAVLALLTSVISCYYYLRVVKFMYFDEPGEPFDTASPVCARFALIVSTTATLLFFLLPGTAWNAAKAAADMLLR